MTSRARSCSSRDAACTLDALAGRARPRAHHRLRTVARRDARTRLRELRRSLGMVGGRARGVLGLDLGVLRGPRVEAVRRRPAGPSDAGGALVHRLRAQLRRARLRGPRRRRDRARPRLRAPPARGDELGRARGSHRSGAPKDCERSGSAAATASPPTSRTPRRRSSPSSPARASGAVWSACSPDFGVRAVVDRFAQIEPKALIAVDGYRYGGRDFDRTAQVAEIRAALPTLEHTICVEYLPAARPLDRSVRWRELLETGAGAPLRFEQLPFDHPLSVLHSSGNNGAPEADRARPGWHPARAPEGAPPASRRPPGRPPVLVHDDGLDDVEHAPRGAPHGSPDRPLRRQRRAPRIRTCSGTSSTPPASRASGRARRTSTRA